MSTCRRDRTVWSRRICHRALSPEMTSEDQAASASLLMHVIWGDVPRNPVERFCICAAQEKVVALSVTQPVLPRITVYPIVSCTAALLTLSFVSFISNATAFVRVEHKTELDVKGPSVIHIQLLGHLPASCHFTCLLCPIRLTAASLLITTDFVSFSIHRLHSSIISRYQVSKKSSFCLIIHFYGMLSSSRPELQ